MKIKHILVIAMTLLLLSGCGNSGSDAADTYAPPALDTETTYYADIDIADYGMIAIQLDQSAVPVTCATSWNLLKVDSMMVLPSIESLRAL